MPEHLHEGVSAAKRCTINGWGFRVEALDLDLAKLFRRLIVAECALGIAC